MAVKKSQNTVSMQVKCSPALRKSFLAACASQDQTASQVLRAYMAKYLAKNGQGDLF